MRKSLRKLSNSFRKSKVKWLTSRAIGTSSWKKKLKIIRKMIKNGLRSWNRFSKSLDSKIKPLCKRHRSTEKNVKTIGKTNRRRCKNSKNKITRVLNCNRVVWTIWILVLMSTGQVIKNFTWNKGNPWTLNSQSQRRSTVQWLTLTVRFVCTNRNRLLCSRRNSSKFSKEQWRN